MTSEYESAPAHKGMAVPTGASVARRRSLSIVAVVLAGLLFITGSAWAVHSQVPSASAAGSTDADVMRAASYEGPAEDRQQALPEAVTITVDVDGDVTEIVTTALTLDVALAAEEIVVGPDDEVSHPLSTQPEDGLEVDISRGDGDLATEEVVDEYETIEEETNDLPRGETEVQTPGEDGITVNTYTLTLLDGEETDRELLTSTVVTERVDEVVLVGTADPEPVEAAPAPEPEPEPSESESNSDSGSSGSSGSSSSGSDSDSSSDSEPSTSSAPVPSGSAQQIAEGMVSDRGWGGDQFQCLVTLWDRESGWNHTATNPTSGAYGIPQSLPGNKMASAGSDWRTNPATQIEWGLGYISDRYGTPCSALSHSNSIGWY